MMRKNSKIRFLAYAAAAAVLALFSALTGCTTSDDGGSTVSEGDTKTFYAYNIETSSYQAVIAVKRYTGTYSIVYVEKDKSSSLSDSLIQEIASEFDTKVYAMVHANFADTSTAEDVDKNGKVILFLLDVQDGYVDGSSGGYVAGFFDATHMYSKATYSASNEADMLFMDIYPGLLTSGGTVDANSYQDFKVTMAHEFQHLVDFSEKVLTQGKIGGNDTWIDEGLSSAAEYLYKGSHIGWKVDYFNYKKYMESLGASYNIALDYNLWGQYFISWNSDTYGNDLVNYSTVYLFFQWLRIHSDSSIYKAILTNSAADYQAVVSAATKISDYSGGTTMAAMIKDWFAANYLNDATGIHGYKNGLSGDGGPTHLYPRYFTALSASAAQGYFGTDSGDSSTYGKIALYPGEAVYMKLGSAKTLADSGSFVYEGLNTSTGSYAGGTYAGGDVLVAANASGLEASPSMSAQLTTFDASTVVATRTDLVDPAASLVLKSLKSSAAPGRKRFPIDAVIGQGTDGRVKSSVSPAKKGATVFKQ